MKKTTRQLLRRFVIVLGCAVVVRIVVAFIVPFSIQPYFSLGIMIAAIISFFVWDIIQGREDES